MSPTAASPDRSACPPDLCCFGECHCTPTGDALATRRTMLRALGLGSAGLALAGVALPLLPTTPFLLLAAWSLARSSPRLEAWLRAHPRIGPPLEAWERRRAIPRPAKAAAVATLPLSGLMVHAAGAGLPVVLATAVVLAGVGGWILSRPS